MLRRNLLFEEQIGGKRNENQNTSPAHQRRPAGGKDDPLQAGAAAPKEAGAAKPADEQDMQGLVIGLAHKGRASEGTQPRLVRPRIATRTDGG